MLGIQVLLPLIFVSVAIAVKVGLQKNSGFNEAFSSQNLNLINLSANQLPMVVPYGGIEINNLQNYSSPM